MYSMQFYLCPNTVANGVVSLLGSAIGTAFIRV
jgi:hypothetical protein